MAKLSVPFQFKALKTFVSQELRSTYVKGMTYTAKDDGLHGPLADAAQRWATEGKVKIIDPQNPAASPDRSKVAGVGTVSSKGE